MSWLFTSENIGGFGLIIDFLFRFFKERHLICFFSVSIKYIKTLLFARESNSESVDDKTIQN